MKYYIEIDDIDIDRFRIDTPCNGSHGNCVLVLKDKNNRTIGFELLKSRPHGEWIRHFDDLFPEESTEECSVCHEEQRITGNDDNFCPHCGADMREGEEK